jgi:hypothetical protein
MVGRSELDVATITPRHAPADLTDAPWKAAVLVELRASSARTCSVRGTSMDTQIDQSNGNVAIRYRGVVKTYIQPRFRFHRARRGSSMPREGLGLLPHQQCAEQKCLIPRLGGSLLNSPSLATSLDLFAERRPILKAPRHSWASPNR